MLGGETVTDTARRHAREMVKQGLGPRIDLSTVASESDPGKGRFFIETFGCQMNVNDSEKVAGLLLAEGYAPAPDASAADVVFVNTCAVREKASEKLFHALGRLRQMKRAKPERVIAVGGCVAQLQGTAILQRAPYVDVLVGTHTVARVPELVRRPGIRASAASTSIARPTASPCPSTWWPTRVSCAPTSP